MYEKLLTGVEIAKILNVSRAFAYQLMRENRIPTVRIGRVVRVRESDLNFFIDNSISKETSFVFDSGNR